MLPLRSTNAQNIGARPYQEDCFAVIDPDSSAPPEQQSFTAVIADGMGGLSHGDAAARLAVQVFVDSFRPRARAANLQQALSDSLLDASAAVAREAEVRNVPGNMGTTLIAAAVRNDRLHWVSTGDSGLFLVRGDEVTRLNRPHIFGAFLDDQVKQGEISEELARGNPHREALTSYVGMPREPEIDGPSEFILLREGDMVMLATDGLFKAITAQQMIEALGEAGDPAESLVQKALAAGLPQQDNVTVLSICCGASYCSHKAVPEEQEETAELRKPDLTTAEPEPTVKSIPPPAHSESGIARWLVLVALAALVGWALFSYVKR